MVTFDAIKAGRRALGTRRQVTGLRGRCESRATVRQILGRTAIRPKLTVSASRVAAEQEANRVVGRRIVIPMLEAGIRSASGRGRRLEKSVQRFFDRRFERDFGDVRIHTDDRAAESARAINARAYTLGNDVVFGRGEYAPGTTEGRRLLAHELTHVVQQGAGGNAQRKLGIGCAPNADIQRAIASTINGVTMEKASSVNDSALKSVVTDQLDAVISSTMDGVALDAIYVSSVNDGTHGENSRHYSDLAVDMSRVKTAGATAWQKFSVHYPGTENVKKVVQALQNGFEGQVGTPGVRENFGPYIKKKNGADWTVGGHGDHIHISCNE